MMSSRSRQRVQGKNVQVSEAMSSDTPWAVLSLGTGAVGQHRGGMGSGTAVVRAPRSQQHPQGLNGDISLCLVLEKWSCCEFPVTHTPRIHQKVTARSLSQGLRWEQCGMGSSGHCPGHGDPWRRQPDLPSHHGWEMSLVWSLVRAQGVWRDRESQA